MIFHLLYIFYDVWLFFTLPLGIMSWFKDLQCLAFVVLPGVQYNSVRLFILSTDI